jgi:hypothetical protein
MDLKQINFKMNAVRKMGKNAFGRYDTSSGESFSSLVPFNLDNYSTSGDRERKK